MLYRSIYIPLVAFWLLPFCQSTLSAQTSTPHYHVVARITIGKTKADFLSIDPVHRKLYGAGDKIIDIDRDSVIGSIAGAGGGYALATDDNRGLVRNGTLFDLITLRITGKIDGKGDASVYDPITHRAFMLNDTTTVVDMTTGSIMAKKVIAHALESGVADGRGKLFINREDSSIVTKVNAKTLEVEARYPVAHCKAAQGLSMDRATRRLFLGCDHELVVLNADNGRVITRIPVSGHADANAFDAVTKFVFNPNRTDSTLVIIHEDTPDRFSVIDTVRVGGGARSMALDEKTHKLYLFYYDGMTPADRQLIIAVLAP
jgi:DNA-binding beta-propeller fold protein YncE